MVSLLLALLARPHVGSAEPQPQIQVLTFEPGADLFSAFGHIALVATLPNGATKVYNFGNYDFVSPGSVWRYAKGDLEYWVSVATLSSTLKRYRHFDRGAVLRELALSESQAERLIDNLERTTRPENRNYRYNHATNNCCTRVRDVINDATGGILFDRFSARSARRTYRGWLRTLLADRPYWLTFIDVSLGPSVDRPLTRYEEQFLPLVLSADLDETILADGKSLVVRKEQLLPQQARPSANSSLCWTGLGVSIGFLLLCVGLAVSSSRWSGRVLGAVLALFGLTLGIVGAWLAFLALGTHADARGNANLLLFPVTHLWLVVPGIALLVRGCLGPRLGPWTKWYLLVSVLAACVALGLDLAGYQDSLCWAAVVLGPDIGVAVAVSIHGRKNRPRQQNDEDRKGGTAIALG
jgi:hypothetical protein